MKNKSTMLTVLTRLVVMVGLQFAVASSLSAQTVLNFGSSTYSETTPANDWEAVHRWAGVGIEGSTTFDMLIQYSGVLGGTVYTGSNGSTAGDGDGFARLSIPGDEYGRFRISFVDPLNSDAAVNLSQLVFSLVDIDHYGPVNDSDPLGRETVRLNTASVIGTGSPSMVESYVGASVANLGPDVDGTFTHRYESTLSSVDNDPINPNQMTQAQYDASLSFSFTDVESFELRLGNSETGKGRNFFFAGPITLVPEPSMVMLSGVGFMVALLRRRRS